MQGDKQVTNSGRVWRKVQKVWFGVLKMLPSALFCICFHISCHIDGLFQELEKINSELENEKKKLEMFTSEIQEEYEQIRE